MQLYLLRHGIAEAQKPGASDATRVLTQSGRRKLRETLSAAAGAGLKPSLILTSPLKRAMQTAEIASEVLAYQAELLQSKALTPGSSPEHVWEEVRGHRDEECLLLVGHNPLFENLAAFLLGQPNLQIEFKKGAIMRIDLEQFPPHPKGVLRWYLTAKLAGHP